MSETMFFSEGQVAVSNARFIVFGRTYAMSAVVSVRCWKESPSLVIPSVLMAVGIFILLAALGAKSWLAMPLGGLLLGAGFVLLRSQKPTHVVVLSTSSGEVQALSSKDPGYISRVVEAVNQALVARG